MLGFLRNWWKDHWRDELEVDFLKLKCPFPKDHVRRLAWLLNTHVAALTELTTKGIEHRLPAELVATYKAELEDAQKAQVAFNEWARHQAMPAEPVVPKSDAEPRAAAPTADAPPKPRFQHAASSHASPSPAAAGTSQPVPRIEGNEEPAEEVR